MSGKRKKNGFTVIEMLVVVAMLAVLALLAVPRLIGTLSNANRNVDTANLEILNRATAVYAQTTGTTGRVFDGVAGDSARMQALLDARLLAQPVSPEQEGASFVWDDGSQSWSLSSSGGGQ